MRLKLIFFPLTLIVSVAILIWVAKPEWEDLKANKSALQALNEKMEKFQTNQQNLQKALNEYENLDESDRQLILGAIPFQANNDDFVAEIFKNVQQSGAFLVSTDLKSSVGGADEQAQKQCLQQMAVAETLLEGEPIDGAAQVTPVYCPVAKKTTNARVEIIGAYGNAKEFVKTVDLQNRLALPTKLEFKTLQGSESEGGDASSDAIRASASFDFFSKPMDQGVPLSNLFDSGDKVLASLMMGAINKQAISAFKGSITSETFRPVDVQEIGKADIFAR